MKYYKVMMDPSGENDIVCHYDNCFGMEQYDLCIGKKFDRWDKRFSFFYSEEEGDVATDYLANDIWWFVISEKLKNVLDELNTDIQYFNVRIIESKSKQPLEGYYVANILTLVDALCLEESDYFETEIEGMGTIYTVSKYALFEDKVNEADVFKLPNHQEIPIFVSERFKNIVENEGITGMEFLEIQTV